MGGASSVGLTQKTKIEGVSENFLDIPARNRFQTLEDSHNTIFEIQENAPTGLDDMVTAVAVPRTHEPKITRSHNTDSMETSLCVEKLSNSVCKQAKTILISTLVTKQTPLETDDKSDVATLGDGGPQFQPTLESGQAYCSVLPVLTSSSYTREEKIPLYIWNQKQYCKDYQACISQNEEVFGYVPITDVKIYWPSSGVGQSTRYY